VCGVIAGGKVEVSVIHAEAATRAPNEGRPHLGDERSKNEQKNLRDERETNRLQHGKQASICVSL
jgi:hypothetical protein